MGSHLHRTAAWAVWLGAGLLVIATAMHPVVADPHDADKAIRHVIDAPREWLADHALMAVAIILWTLGLAACGEALAGRTRSESGAGLFTASMAMWLVTLAFELGGFPVAVRHLADNDAPYYRDLAESLFSSLLISGYLAMVPAWLGVLKLAATLNASILRKWQRIWGVTGGILGLAGIGFSLLRPSAWVMLVATAVPFAWTLLLAWKCRGAAEKASRPST